MKLIMRALTNLRRNTMNAEKVASVFQGYVRELNEKGCFGRRLEDNKILFKHLKRRVVLNHLAWMCKKGILLAEEGSLDKAFRWLGFVQGVLWALSIYPIHDLKNHNRPDGPQ